MKTLQNKGLGRGLSALLPETIGNNYNSNLQNELVKEIPVERIHRYDKQPRINFDQEKLQALADSIKTAGILQPILVKKHPTLTDNYQIIAGERRLKAAIIAELKLVPAIIRDIDENDILEIALIENLQRDELNPIEEAQAYQTLMLNHNYSHEKLGQRLGKGRSTISNLIRLLSLPEQIKNDLIKEQLTVGHARALLNIGDATQQNFVRERIISQKLSVRETEDLVRKLKATNKKQTKKIDQDTAGIIDYNENRLSELFSTKVKISGSENKGKIEFHYFNKEDFNRIFLAITEKGL